MASFPNERETQLTLEIERLLKSKDYSGPVSFWLKKKERKKEKEDTNYSKERNEEEPKTLQQVCCTVGIKSLE